MKQKLPYAIQFKDNWVVRNFKRVIGNTQNRFFISAHVESDGLSIKPFLRSAIKIRWSEITCLSLDSLTPMGTGNPFVLIMSSNETLIKRCARGDQKKLWFAATNVLGITQIERYSAIELKMLLKKISQEHNIKLDGIALEW